MHKIIIQASLRLIGRRITQSGFDISRKVLSGQGARESRSDHQKGDQETCNLGRSYHSFEHPRSVVAFEIIAGKVPEVSFKLLYSSNMVH